MLLLLLALFGLTAPRLEAASPATLPGPLNGKVIVLDPGHAVMDRTGKLINPGARARLGAYERDIALSVAEKVTPLLEAQGAKVYRTRTKDNPWRYGAAQSADNRSRAVLANVLSADAYIRIHCDWNRSRSFQGYTLYYFHWQSRGLAENVRHAFSQAFPQERDNGIHRRTFVSVTATMPTVLVEMGVLSHKSEAKLLGSEAYQQQLAQALAGGIVDYFFKQR